MIPCRTASAQHRYGGRLIGITGASAHKFEPARVGTDAKGSPRKQKPAGINGGLVHQRLNQLNNNVTTVKRMGSLVGGERFELSTLSV